MKTNAAAEHTGSRYSIEYRDRDGHRRTTDFDAQSPAGALFHVGRLAPGTWATPSRQGDDICALERTGRDNDFWLIRTAGRG
jgi:hypothetical protein